jgi:two-component sensor histidine kinase
MDAYVRAVEGRISALARIHTILSLSSWQGAEIRRLVDEELAPYAVAGQIKVSGLELQLEPATAQTLALAFHELVTNSAKYGALSAVAGRVSVQWELRDDDTLMLAWEEIGGPVVHKPKSRGFGTRSVIASVESQLGGQALFDWRSEGLVCRLLVPISPQAAMPDTGDRAAPPPLNVDRRRQAGSAAP